MLFRPAITFQYYSRKAKSANISSYRGSVLSHISISIATLRGAREDEKKKRKEESHKTFSRVTDRFAITKGTSAGFVVF